MDICCDFSVAAWSRSIASEKIDGKNEKLVCGMGLIETNLFDLFSILQGSRPL